MSDLEMLYEAYANESWEAERDADLHRALGKGKFSPWERDIERLLVRNAQYRDLLANGQRAEARKRLEDGKFRWLVEVPGSGEWLLIDPPTEEE